MVANWLKILLFAAGGSTAAAGTVYYTGIYDPWATEESATPMATAEPAKPQSAAPEPASVQAEPQDEPEAAAEATEADDEPAADAAVDDEPAPQVAAVAKPETTAQGADDLVVPSFDIVRVEPDGSMVIAGSAEPNSQIEVVAGADVIARADVGPAGDFAAVLDDALRPGDYQIVLRSTGPGEGLVTTSQETAIVSVPEDQRGDVLALVEEPGAPSRLITLPEGEADAAAAEPETTEPAEVAAAQASPDVTDVDVAAQPGTGEAASDAEEPAASAAPEEDGAAEESEPEAEVAARSQPEPDAAPTQDRPASPRNALAVEAIEIEGGTVFVAGRGAAGSTVRVYANEILLGEARVSDGGRFLIETQTDLPVGDYIVRADIIGPGGEVTARAAVPFQREPGEAVAAVAPVEAAPPASEAEPAASETTTGDDVAAADPVSQPEPSREADASEAPAATAESSSEETAPTPESPAAASTEAAPEAPADVAAATPAIEETMAAPLEAADGAVIIRRGDTLWRISRRVYGRGVRYSTIYLANQEQIRDPDMIWPGQIFSVPDETEEGEKADMSTVSDQIAPADTIQ
jgi:nucleoid-associated protein YgaU